jgi:hypothetical protein
LCIGGLLDYHNGGGHTSASSSYSSIYTPVPGGYTDGGSDYTTSDGHLMVPANKYLPTMSQTRSLGMPVLRFDSGLKVDIKMPGGGGYDQGNAGQSGFAQNIALFSLE